MLTHNRFNTYTVLIFSFLNKAQIYIPYRDGPQNEIEIVMSFKYMNVFKPNEHTEDYDIRKLTNENFLFGIEGKKYIYAGEKVIILKQMMEQ